MPAGQIYYTQNDSIQYHIISPNALGIIYHIHNLSVQHYTIYNVVHNSVYIKTYIYMYSYCNCEIYNNFHDKLGMRRDRTQNEKHNRGNENYIICIQYTIHMCIDI